MFGGTRYNEKLADFWSFTLSNQNWTKIVTESCPNKRNGHSTVCYKDKIFLFGGIHQITCEKNDIWLFDSVTQVWTELEPND